MDENSIVDDDNENANDGLLNGTMKSMDGSTAKSLLAAAKTPLTQSQIAFKKRREAFEAMQEAAYELFNYFNHKNLDSLIKLVRFTLEKLRKRITASQAILAYKEAKHKGK